MTKKPGKKPTVKTSHKRGTRSYGIEFEGARSINKKMDAFDESKEVDKILNKGLFSSKAYQGKGKGYKPPRGIVVVIEGKRTDPETGKKIKTVSADVSPTTLFIDRKSAKAYIKGVVEKKQGDYADWKSENEGEPTDSGENFNPDSISKIDIKFIY